MRGLAGTCYAVGKPAWIKPVGVGTPYGRIPVNQSYWDPEEKKYMFLNLVTENTLVDLVSKHKI